VIQNQKYLFNFVNIVVTYTELRYFKAERSARHLGLAIGIVSYTISRDAMGWDAGKYELARMRLSQAVESWHCSLAENLEVFKAEADFASDCMWEAKWGGFNFGSQNVLRASHSA
jgi:hypothetical protein